MQIDIPQKMKRCTLIIKSHQKLRTRMGKVAAHMVHKTSLEQRNVTAYIHQSHHQADVPLQTPHQPIQLPCPPL